MNTTVVLAVSISVACWLASGLRRAPDGHWLATTRDGRVRRVCDRGWAWRIPLLEQFTPVAADPHEQPLVVRATTSDGARVLVLCEATILLPRPRPGTPYADPWRGAERVAEQTVARAVEGWRSEQLAASASAGQRTLRHAVSAAVDEYGVTLLELDLVGLEVQLEVLDARLDDRLDDRLDEPAASRGPR